MRRARPALLSLTLAPPMVALLTLAVPACAQTVSGQPSPYVRGGTSAMEARVAFAPGGDGLEDRWAGRWHYQRDLDDVLRARVVLQGADFEGDFELTHIQAELLWEVDPDPLWGKAIRFDARLTDGDDGADQLGLVSIHHFKLTEQAYARASAFGNVQFGNDRGDGIGVEIRGRLGYRVDANTDVFVDSFNALGRGQSFGSFRRNRERAGPGISHRFGTGWSLLGGILFGLNDATPDTDIRVWLGKSL